VLIGRHIIDSDDVVVDRVTSPLAGDRRTRTAFRRAQEKHQAVLDDEWDRSNGRRVYLGEWHTHPEPSPRPSGVDLDDWQRRLRHDTVEARFLFFLIVGQGDLRIWEGSRTTFGVAPLRRRRPLDAAGNEETV
jgi:integrative and conjugative element protein (TIGR02256 family)